MTDEEVLERETATLKEMVALNSIVLATGGGIVIENRELLASRGTVFYLHTPLSTQVERTAKDKDRPLLKDKDPEKVLADLQKSRQSLYEAVSDHIINTENKSGPEVANEIVKLVKNYLKSYAGQRKNKYRIVIGKDAIVKNLIPLLKCHNKTLIISDDGVPFKILKQVTAVCKPSTKLFKIILQHGEKAKSVQSFKNILNFLAVNNFDRTDLIVAVGGGVVGDISGYVASSYLRGNSYKYRQRFLRR